MLNDLSFIDDHNMITWVYLIKEKSEVGIIFKNFHSMIQTQFQAKVKIFRSDNAKEFFNSNLGNYFVSQGIIQQSSCADTPQQNGITERKNRHLLEVARSLMFTMNVPKCYWGEAVLTATYLINRMPSRSLKFQTPHQVLSQSFPSIRIMTTLPMKIFGCSVFVHVHQQYRNKLDPKSLKCIFIGYSPTQKGYKCYSPAQKRYYTSMDVKFFDTQFYYPKTYIQGENTNIQECNFWLDREPSPSPIQLSIRVNECAF